MTLLAAMKTRAPALVLFVALFAAATAHAQEKVFRCVDERGAVYYTEKPTAGCRQVRIDAAPAQAAPARPLPKADAPGAKTPVRQSAAAQLTQKSHCEALSKGAAQLREGKTSLDSAAAARRREGVEAELARSCSGY